jgi:hypothetical protein
VTWAVAIALPLYPELFPRSHVFPMFDIHEHCADIGCLCKPYVSEQDAFVILHNAMDQRTGEFLH